MKKVLKMIIFRLRRAFVISLCYVLVFWFLKCAAGKNFKGFSEQGGGSDGDKTVDFENQNFSQGDSQKMGMHPLIGKQ